VASGGIGWPGEAHHPRFGGVQGEPIFGEPLGENRHEALRIAFDGAENHQVIGKAVEGGFPVKPWTDHLLKPRVEDGMEKDIRQERRHPRPLRYPSIWVRHAPVF